MADRIVRKGIKLFIDGNLMTKGIAMLGDLANKAKEFVKQGIEMAAKAEGISTAFKKLNQPDLLRNLRTETKGLLSDLTLMTAANKANNFNIPVDKLGTLLKFAQQRAQETGESVEYLSQSIITGLGRKSPLILDNLGISAVKLQERAKKTGDFMQATIDIVNEELAKQGDLSLTSADKATQAAIKWENAQLRIGQKMSWLGNLWNSISGSMADAVSSLAGKIENANEAYENQLQKVAELNVNTLPLIEKYNELSKKVSINVDNTGSFNDEETELLTLINQISTAIPGVVTEWDKHGNAIRLNTEAAKDYIATQQAILEFDNKDNIKYQIKNIDGCRPNRIGKISIPKSPS
jgi:hypothetical protein